MSGALSIPATPPWPDLRARSTDPELLDASLPESEVRKSLADLRFVNRWLGSRRGLLRAMAPYLPPRGRLLDVGCASGDVTAFLRAGLPGLSLAVVKVKAVRNRPPRYSALLTAASAGSPRTSGSSRSGRGASTW